MHHPGSGRGQTEAHRGRRGRRSIDADRTDLARAGSVDAEGLDPAPGLSVKRQSPVDGAGRHLAAGKAGGRHTQFEPRPAIATPALDIGIRKVAGQDQSGVIAPEAGQARPIGRSGKTDSDTITGRRQFEGALQPLGLEITAPESRCGHPGAQSHQLAVVEAGVAEDVNRTMVGVEPRAGALDKDQRAAAVGTGRAAGKALDQGIQRAERQPAVTKAGAHHRADQADTRRREPEPRFRPWRADSVVDLDPFDDHIGVRSVADADAGHQTVQFQPLDLQIGLDALLIQPSDQEMSRRRAPVQVEEGRQDQQHAEDRAHDQQGAATACADGAHGRRSAIGHGPVISARKHGRKGR